MHQTTRKIAVEMCATVEQRCDRLNQN